MNDRFERQRDLVPIPRLADLTVTVIGAYKAIRLDEGISGSDLTRPGFLAFNADALKDETISHVFFYKRDRFARPDDAMQAAQIEKSLRSAGITVVHSDGVSLPLRRGEQNFLHDLEPRFSPTIKAGRSCGSTRSVSWVSNKT
jgi:hypothetical protein